MKIQFVTPKKRNPRLLAEVEIVFETELPGLKLVGFNLWRKPNETDPKEVYVTLPSRAYDMGKDRRYFDFLRSARERYEDTSDIRKQIIDAWNEGR